MNKDKELEEAIKRCNNIITTKFNNDYSIDSIDKEAIKRILQILENKENKINKCIETINELKAGRYIKGEKGYMSSSCCNARLDIIQELLEDK